MIHHNLNYIIFKILHKQWDSEDKPYYAETEVGTKLSLSLSLRKYGNETITLSLFALSSMDVSKYVNKCSLYFS